MTNITFDVPEGATEWTVIIKGKVREPREVWNEKMGTPCPPIKSGEVLTVGGQVTIDEKSGKIEQTWKPTSVQTFEEELVEELKEANPTYTVGPGAEATVESPKKRPSQNIGRKMSLCPKCGRTVQDERLESHMKTAYCQMKAGRDARKNAEEENKEIFKKYEKLREASAEIGAIRCRHCDQVSRTYPARDKHEARCMNNPERKRLFATTHDTSLEASEPTSPTPVDKSDEPSLEEEFDTVASNVLAIEPKTCPDCGRTIFVPLEMHKRVCKPFRVDRKAPVEVKPLDVTKLIEPVPEEEKYKDFKIPAPTQHLPGRLRKNGTRHCTACGVQIDKKRKAPLCDKCAKLSSSRTREAAKDVEKASGAWN